MIAISCRPREKKIEGVFTEARITVNDCARPPSAGTVPFAAKLDSAHVVEYYY